MWRDRLEQRRAPLDEVEPEEDLWQRALDKPGDPPTRLSPAGEGECRVCW